MAKSFSILGAIILVAVLATGCTSAEKKFGRGINNMYEPIRLAEMRRSIEQTSFTNPDEINYHTGVFRGVKRTLARTGLGIYEAVTGIVAIPNYHFDTKSWDYDAVCTDYLSPNPKYPDAYRPGLFEDPTFATDTAIGFSGGDVAPFMPGSRFRVFDN